MQCAGLATGGEANDGFPPGPNGYSLGYRHHWEAIWTFA